MAQRKTKSEAVSRQEWTRMSDKSPDDFASPAAETEAATGGGPDLEDDRDRIRHRAYQIWENAGRPDGRDLEHWLQAEHEMVARGGGGSRVGVPGETATTQPEAGPKAPAQPGISAELGGSPSAAARGSGRQL